MRNQPAFLNADTPIRLHSDVTVTPQPLWLRAVSPFACWVNAASLLRFTPPNALRLLTPMVLGRKALCGADSPLNSPPKNSAPLPRDSRFAHANRNAPGMPVPVGETAGSRKPSPAPGTSHPRAFSRCTIGCDFSIYKHCSGKNSLPISLRKQVSRSVGAPALLSALSGAWLGLPVRYSQDGADN